MPNTARSSNSLLPGNSARLSGCARAAIKRARKDAVLHALLGESLYLAGRLDDAASSFRAAGRVDRQLVSAHAGLAKTRVRQTRFVEAERAFNSALRVNPGHAESVAGLAELLEMQGRTDEAMTLMAELNIGATSESRVAITHTRLLQRLHRHDDVVTYLVDWLRQHEHECDAVSRQHLWCGLGRSYDSMGDYASAFEAFEQGNSAVRRAYDAQAQDRFCERIMRTYSHSNLQQVDRSPNTSELPVFVASMPRCGSTLCERILSAHPGRVCRRRSG